ncbi:rhamnan synthesis F family protein [Agrococcus beijingensis]|uniref:rhamnan synthesis F family protein n=1 Tax=Agrococcus beijingensis TaxID=3068634 RepID=UPI0027424C75|nr:rhamnan synthesis F family protein [Agrococcus sp. REN33]
MRLSNIDGVRRLGIFFFYDAEGRADDYVFTLLDSLAPHFSQQIVVVNGELDEASRARFTAMPGTELLVRANEGFDSWAYKAALDHLGWEAVDAFDELIMYNFTIVGPVASFDAMFERMDDRDLDFWGITVHHGAPFDPWGLLETPTLQEHIQSHFIAVRRSLASSALFHTYWDKLPPIPDYAHAVAKHEARFTHHFAAQGFAWAPYVDTSDMRSRTFYPLNTLPVELIRDRECPIFKRKTLFAGQESVLDENGTRNARDLYDFLDASGRYDMAVLREHMQRTMDQRAQFQTMHDFILLPEGPPADPVAVPSSSAIVSTGVREPERTALAAALADEVVLAGPEPRIAAAQTRAVAARRHAITAAAQVDGDVILLVDVDGFPEEMPSVDAEDRRWAVREALGSDRATAERVLAEFARDPLLGMVVAPPSLHRGWFGELGHEWDGAHPDFHDIRRALGVTVPTDPRGAPLAAVGGAAWIRRSAILPFAAAVEAAPAGLLVGLSLADWGRLLPLAVQQQGYAVRIALSPALAKNLLSISLQTLRRIGAAAGHGAGEGASQLVARLDADAKRGAHRGAAGFAARLRGLLRA